MTEERFPEERCRIILRGHIDPRWVHWFEEMEITHLPGDQTQLLGTVVDDSAFNGLLSKIRDLGLSILRVERGACQSNQNDESREG